VINLNFLRKKVHPRQNPGYAYGMQDAEIPKIWTARTFLKFLS